jgi:putative oxidoreductase
MAGRNFRKFLTGRSKGLQELSLLLLRLCLGLWLIYGHAWPKIDHYDLMKFTFSDPLGIGRELSLQLAIAAEAGCSLLLILGLWTRFALIPLIFTMGVIIFKVQWDAGFGKMELPLLYMLGFVVLLLQGPGRYSIDEK